MPPPAFLEAIDQAVANWSLELSPESHDEAIRCLQDETTSFSNAEMEAVIDTAHALGTQYRGQRVGELENGYVVYGYRSSVHDYSDVHYVGDLRNCEACHVDDSYMLPLPDGLLPVTTPSAQFTPMLPETASCLSCHDGDSAASHALSNTSALGEACATCHGEGKRYSVEAVHAR